MILRAVSYWGVRHRQKSDPTGRPRDQGGEGTDLWQGHSNRTDFTSRLRGKRGPGWESLGGCHRMPFPAQAAGASLLPFELEGEELSDSESPGTQWDPSGSASTQDSRIRARSQRPAACSPPGPGEQEGRRGSGHRDVDDPRAGTVDGN